MLHLAFSPETGFWGLRKRTGRIFRSLCISHVSRLRDASGSLLETDFDLLDTSVVGVSEAGLTGDIAQGLIGAAAAAASGGGLSGLGRRRVSSSVVRHHHLKRGSCCCCGLESSSSVAVLGGGGGGGVGRKHASAPESHKSSKEIIAIVLHPPEEEELSTDQSSEAAAEAGARNKVRVCVIRIENVYTRVYYIHNCLTD